MVQSVNNVTARQHYFVRNKGRTTPR